MRALVVSIVCSLCALSSVKHDAMAQDVFAGKDSGGGQPEGFDAGDGNSGPENFADRERYRPLPSYTNCGPWYNSYDRFVHDMMRHYGGMCEVRNGNQVWCHARIAGNCNADATGGRPDSPVLDTGVRYTPQCQSICDRTVAQPVPPPPFPTPVLRRPIDLSADDLPCSMPSLEQLAQAPDGGDFAVAAALPPEGGDVAEARRLPPQDGEVAIALALPSTKTLTGGVTETGVFAPQPPPLVLRGKATINGWPLPPQNGYRLQGYATKSLRIPVTYKTTNGGRPTVSTGVQGRIVPTDHSAKIHMVLTGGAHHYSEEEGRYRCISGFLQGMAAEMSQQARTGEAEKAKAENKAARQSDKARGTTCEIRANPPQAFEDAVVHPDEEPIGAGKFVTDMLDKVFHNNKELEEQFPKLKQSLKFLGPLLEGAGLVKSFKDTYEVMTLRDQRIRKIIQSSPDRFIDPAQFCWFVGQDAADTYALTVRSIFSLKIK